MEYGIFKRLDFPEIKPVPWSGRHWLTFVEEHHDLGEGLHEVDVVVAVLLDLQQQAELRLTLGGEGFQQKAVLLQDAQEKHVG